MIRKKTKLMLVFFIVMLSLGITGCSQAASVPDVANKDQNVEVLFDAPSFSRITKAALFEKFGETSDIEKWNNKTEKGTFPMTIYSYDDKNSNHYEFIIADDKDSVVRVTIYSSKNWAGKGTDLKYQNKTMKDMLALLNIIPNDTAKVTDTGYAYRISPVSDKVGDVWFTGISKDDSIFEMVKITYNLNYFD